MKSLKTRLPLYLPVLQSIVTMSNLTLFCKNETYRWATDNNKFMDHRSDYFYQASLEEIKFFFDRVCFVKIGNNFLFENEEFKT